MSLFQVDNMMTCGAIGDGLNLPNSPAVGTYGISTEDLLKKVSAATQCGPTETSWPVDEDEQIKSVDVEAAFKSMEQRNRQFEPHLCENKEFFVINGSTSIDFESLSVPSMGDLKNLGLSSYSGSDTSDSPQRRVYITSSPARGSPDGSGGAGRDHAPRTPPKTKLDPIFETAVHASTNMAGKKTIENEETLDTKAKTFSTKKIQPKEPEKVEPTPPMQTEEDLEREMAIINEQRLRELISPRTPERPAEIKATSQFLKEMQALVPSCYGPLPYEAKDKPMQAPEVELKVISNPADTQLSEETEMNKYWKEKFSQAANKVIEKSSVRCMEIIDPTIPREDDPPRRKEAAAKRPKGRQRYRKVLRKYRRHRILVLIMDPSTKLYEILELPYRPDETTVADVLIMARIQTTDDRLRYQDYVGLCRPNLNPPPPPSSNQTENESPRNKPVLQTPPRHPALPPKVNRVTGSKCGHLVDGREDDSHSLSSELTANTRNHLSSCMLEEITVPEELVWNLLSSSSATSVSGSSSEAGSAFSASSIPSEFTMSLPYVTLPLLGDIVVTIPQGYTGEEVSRHALTILQTPLFLRWVHRRYLQDLQRDNDELLSRVGAAVGGTQGEGAGAGGATFTRSSESGGSNSRPYRSGRKNRLKERPAVY